MAEAAQRSDLWIQATPLGLMNSDPLPIAEACLHAGLKIYDTVYRKDFTPLVRTARAQGIPAQDGLGMLLHQGARALAIWTGQTPPLATMRTALEKAAGRPV